MSGSIPSKDKDSRNHLLFSIYLSGCNKYSTSLEAITFFHYVTLGIKLKIEILIPGYDHSHFVTLGNSSSFVQPLLSELYNKHKSVSTMGFL